MERKIHLFGDNANICRSLCRKRKRFMLQEVHYFMVASILAMISTGERINIKKNLSYKECK